VLAPFDRRERHVGRFDRELDAHRAVGEATVDVPSGSREDVQHLGIARQRVGGERVEPVRARDHGEMLEQQRRDAAAVLVVPHCERDLRSAVVDAVVTRHRDDRAADQRRQRHVVVVVDEGEPVEPRRSRTGQGREETEVDRLLRQTLVELEHALVVVGTQRPHVDEVAVGQDDVALPLGGVGRCLVHRSAHGVTTARPSMSPSRKRS
jgi:hypothetical protein